MWNVAMFQTIIIVVIEKINHSVICIKRRIKKGIDLLAKASKSNSSLNLKYCIQRRIQSI